MAASILYKYLDVDGARKMLALSNLQFTNATQLNDPFDCHPGLLDFSNVPDDELTRVWGKERIALLKSNPHELLRSQAWICSLSKVHDSLLMWSYYGNHKGVCIGIDMAKAAKYLSNLYCALYVGAEMIEVEYKEIVEKPDYFNSSEDLFRYQLGTKAKDWEHEQEVRLVLREPSPAFIPMYLPGKKKSKNEVVDWREVRAYPHLGGECFESLYLGIKINEKKKNELIELARNLNPEIRIYQMRPNPFAFRLEKKLL